MDQARFEGDLATLTESEQVRISKLRQPKDQRRALVGRLLLRSGLERLGAGAYAMRSLRYTSYGKPFLEGGPSFNISHSGELVVCALSSEGRVGVDVEALRPIALDDFADCMNADQWHDISGAADPSQRFLDYWTMKEGLVKCRGEGLGLPLDAITAHGERLSLAGETWVTRRLAIDPGYVCHVAARDLGAGVRVEAL